MEARATHGASRLLAFNEGVFLLPVTELADEVRSKLGAEEGDFALTRPQGRSASKLLDPQAAALLERFRQPRSLVEAVILFSRALGENPEQVLDEAYPLIKGLLASGYLVPVEENGEAPHAGGQLAGRWRPGEELLGGRVLRLLQVLEDTELYLLARDGVATVLKVVRIGDPRSTRRTRSLLEREAVVLRALPAGLAPRLLGQGLVGADDERFYLELELILGAELEAAAAVAREAVPLQGRGELLALLRSVARAYARLHEGGFVHGDVHPRNVLVERSGAVRLIDFGWSVPADGGIEGSSARAGVPFFYEPELARCFLEHRPVVRASAAGEQYAVGAMLYFLAAGAYCRDYSLGRDEMLREIVELPPLSFEQRGAPPWPELEAVLGRALAKDPAQRFPSMAALAAALETVEAPPSEASAARRPELLGRCLDAADPGGSWGAGAELPAPTASINYGAAGLALGLLSIAKARGEARPMALARPWLARALAAAGDEAGFYNAEIEITRDTVGAASPYHSAAGVFAVEALLARAAGDTAAQARATTRFLLASEEEHHGLDLTLGSASTLLGAALLLDAWPRVDGLEEDPLREHGERRLRELWRELDARPAIVEADVDALGIAHGWAGFLYATLTWCEVAGGEPPPSLRRRLDELAALAVPEGRGLTWPWMLAGEGSRVTMPGWCNGSAGYVFLWTLAARLLGESRYADLALGAGWASWDAPDLAASLCCGIAGRGYALLNLHRFTGEPAWLDRARQLAERAAAFGAFEHERPHSLWKGELGLAALIADLEHPEEAAMPFFEPFGYRVRRG